MNLKTRSQSRPKENLPLPERKRSALKPMTYFLGFFVSAICLFIAFGKLDWAAFSHELFTMDWRYLVLGLVLTLLHNFLMAGRWYVILRKLGKLSYWNAYWSLRISYFFNASLPARLGEPFRIFYLKRFTRISAGRAIGAMGADRFLDFITLVALLYLSALVLGLRGTLPTTKTIVLGALLSISLLFVLGKLPSSHSVRWLDWLLKFRVRVFEGIAPLRSWKVLVPSVPLSFMGWIVNAVMLVGFSYGVGEPISIFKAFVVIAGIVLVVAIPSSPGNFGTFELAAIAVLKYFNVPYERAAAIAILFHMIQLLPTLAIGAYGYHFHFLRGKPFGRKEKPLVVELENAASAIDHFGESEALKKPINP